MKVKHDLINFSKRLDAVNFSSINNLLRVEPIVSAYLSNDLSKGDKDRLKKGVKITNKTVKSEFDKLLEKYMNEAGTDNIAVKLEDPDLYIYKNKSNEVIVSSSKADTYAIERILNEKH